jgi:hypothetical protein
MIVGTTPLVRWVDAITYLSLIYIHNEDEA